MKYHLLYCYFLKFRNVFIVELSFLASDKVYAFQKTHLIGILKFNLIIHLLFGVFYHLYIVITNVFRLVLLSNFVNVVCGVGVGNPTLFF